MFLCRFILMLDDVKLYVTFLFTLEKKITEVAAILSRWHYDQNQCRQHPSFLITLSGTVIAILEWLEMHQWFFLPIIETVQKVVLRASYIMTWISSNPKLAISQMSVSKQPDFMKPVSHNLWLCAINSNVTFPVARKNVYMPEEKLLLTQQKR